MKSEHDSCSDGYVMSYDDDGDDDDEKKIMDIKVEAGTDVETQQEASDMTFLAENFKHEVSFFMRPFIHSFSSPSYSRSRASSKASSPHSAI